MTVCIECGGTTEWDDNASSHICTRCGTMVDASQTVLTSHPVFNETSSLVHPLYPTILKSFRNGSNWDLSGQSKESRNSRNAYAMNQFITSLAVTISFPAQIPRAINIFNQAMNSEKFRWGRKAKLLAGACLSIALREAKLPDSLHEIAFIIDASHTQVARTRTSLIYALQLPLTISDPAAYITSLESHIQTTLQDARIPTHLLPLKGVSLNAVSNTTRDLVSLLTRFAHDLAVTSPSAVAAASFILAIEAELRVVLPKLGNFAEFLGSKCNIGKVIVMKRFEAIQDEVIKWMQNLPWLDGYEKGDKRRAKVSKRVIIARGLKDVLRWQNDNWTKNMEECLRPTFSLEIDDTDDTDSLYSSSGISLSCVVERRHGSKRKRPSALTQATDFLLNPVQASSTSLTSPELLPHIPLTAYILNSSSDSGGHQPTRLQLLGVERGGSDASHIPDDELFDAEEWNSVERSEEEIASLRNVYDFQSEQPVCWEEKTNGKCGDNTPPQKKQRIDMTVFNHFMQDDEGDSDEDVDHSLTYLQFGSVDTEAGEDGVVLDDWRPLSP